MESHQKSLAQEILDTAHPELIGGNTLAPDEEAYIAKMVEQEVRSVLMDLGSEGDRSQFTFAKNFLEGVNGSIVVDLFPNKRLKQEAAKRLAKEHMADWQGYIRRSPLLKLLLVSTKEFIEEVGKH